jgi:hypothetical protein
LNENSTSDAEVEGENLAIWRHVPAFRQFGLDIGGPEFEPDQVLVDRDVGVEGGPRGVEHRVEVLGRAFGAVDEGFAHGRAGGHCGGEREHRYASEGACGQTHGKPFPCREAIRLQADQSL